MAKVIKGTTERTETITVTEPQYILTLSQEEAEAVAALCGHVFGGDYKTSPRKHTYAVLNALMAANVNGSRVKPLIKTPPAVFKNYFEFQEYAA